MPVNEMASEGDDEVCYGQVVGAQCGVAWFKIREIFGDSAAGEWRQITCTFGPSHEEKEPALCTDEYGCIGTFLSRTSNALRLLMSGQEGLPKIRWDAYLRKPSATCYWPAGSNEVELKLLLYGPRSKTEETVKLLAEKKVLLQDPFKAIPGAETCNTHDSDAAQCAENQVQRPGASRDMSGEHKGHHTAEKEPVMVDGKSLVRSPFTLALKAAANPKIPPATEARKRKRVEEDSQEEHRGPSREHVDRLVSECVSTMERCGASTIALSRKYVLYTTKEEIQTSVRKLGVLQGKLIACILELMSGRSSVAQDPNDLSMGSTGTNVEITQQIEARNGLQAASRPMERAQNQLVGQNAGPKITQLKQKNAIIKKQTGVNKKKNADRSKQARELKQKIASLKKQNTELKQEHAELKAQKTEFNQMNADLSEQNIELNLLISNLEEQNAQLKDQDVRLKEDIAELGEQIQKHEAGHTALVVKAGECILERDGAIAARGVAIVAKNEALAENERNLAELQRIGLALQDAGREREKAIRGQEMAQKNEVAAKNLLDQWEEENARLQAESESLRERSDRVKKMINSEF